MSEGGDINITRDLLGNAINTNTGQITNNFISYQRAQPQYVDQTTLTAAQELLATLPLDRIPNLASLPSNSRMLFARNPLFTGREHELMELARIFKDSETTVVPVAAITGMGGLGKTQLATEFAHRYGQFFAGGVFWLSFADPATIPTEIAACSVQSSVQFSSEFGRQSLLEQLEAVGAAWKGPLPRLLVFDNCEDEELLSTWWPKTGGCCILITSRRAHWDRALGVHHLPLHELRPEESVTLLRKHRPDLPSDDQALQEIAKTLGHLPLAIHLAGNFLAEYKHVIDLQTYLEQLHSPALLQHQSLSRKGYSPTEYEQDVARAFALSYERLDAGNAVDQQARDLLARAAYLVPGELIPRDLLMAVVEPAESAGSYQFVHALKRLIDTGLLEEVGDDMFRVHRLVVAFVRTVTNDTSVQQAVEIGLLSLATRLEEGKSSARLIALLPHLKEITDTVREREDYRAGKLCNILSKSLRMAGDYAKAHFYAAYAVRIMERAVGSDHPDTATSLIRLAEALARLADYTGARPLVEHALDIRERQLGPDHPDTAACLNDLGWLLTRQGDYVAARPLMERALAIREQTAGPDHPDTATSLTRLAEVLVRQGDHMAARRLVERALDIRERHLGPEHPETAASLNDLGWMLSRLGDYVAARPLMERTLEIEERVLGPEHPDTAASLSGLGQLLIELGDYTGARRLVEQALDIRERVLGPDHPDTAASLNNLGYILRQLGDYTAARPIMERVVTIQERVLGPDHPDTAVCLANLGELLRQLEDYTGARPLVERALKIQERVLGPEHIDTAKTLNNLGMLLYNLRDYNHAKPLSERAIAIFDQVFGPLHPDSFAILSNLAQMHFFHGNKKQARKYLARALDTLEHNPSLKNVSKHQLQRQLGLLGGSFRRSSKPKSKRKK